MVYFRFCRKNGNCILDTIEKDYDKFGARDVSQILPYLYRGLSYVYFFKVPVLFDFYHLTVTMSNLEADFVLYKVADSETLKENSARARKAFNTDLHKVVWSMEFKKVVVDIIDIKPIKLQNTDILKNRLLLVFKYDPV